MDGGDEGDGLLYDGGVRRRLESSSPSVSNSTSHLCFLVHFAGGNIGGGASAGAGGAGCCYGDWDRQACAVVVAGGHRW
jgi:hypothetical protein